jgi:uncharacterized protein YndB with AHSA1/START domain
MNSNTTAAEGRQKIKIERSYRAPLEDVWELWTTKEGIESWWGPEGFAVTVQALDLRVGGRLLYTMTAVLPAQIEFMKRAGMPLSTPARITYTAIEPQRRLAYTHAVDFVPGVEAYEVVTLVELQPSGDSVRLLLTLDAMHDEMWTERMAKGWESELGKLERALTRLHK